MKKLMFAAVAAVVCVGAWADVAWRYSADGGTTWSVESESTEFTLPTLVASTANDNVVEFLTDCTYATYVDIPNAKGLTLRSAPGRTCTLTRAASVMFAIRGTMVVTNLTIDGGAVWTKPADITSLDSANGISAAFAYFTGTLTLQSGATLCNFKFPSQTTCTAGTAYTMLGAGGGSGHTLNILPGAVIRDCRGQSSIVLSGTNNMSGGEIYNCYTESVGLYFYAGIFCHKGVGSVKMTGGSIHDNVTTRYGAVNATAAGARFYFSGTPVVEGNLLDTGASADVVPFAADDINQNGDLEAGASIGVGYPAIHDPGVVFGKASSSEFAGAKSFFNAEDRYGTIGKIDGGNLVWSESDLPHIQGSIDAASFVRDGAPHAPAVNLTTPGCTVLWSASATGPFTETPPFSEAGVHMVFYRATADGYVTLQGGQFVSIYEEGATEGYRVSADGGASWARSPGTVFTLPAFVRNDANSNIVEFERPCTYGETMSFANGVTLRSSGETPVTLTRTAAKLWYNLSTIVISNLTVDGGTVWTKAKPYSDLACTGVGGCSFIQPKRDLNGTVVTLGAGCTLRNFYTGNPDYCYALIGEASGRDHTVNILPGSLICDIRGGYPIVLGGTVRMSGGEITRCSGSGASNSCYGQFALNSGNTYYLTGGWIHDNLATKNGAINVLNSNARLRISGSFVVEENYLESGVASDIYTASAGTIVQSGDLDGTAAVGVACTAATKVGDKFGTAEDASFAGAERFFLSADRYNVVGVNDAGVLRLAENTAPGVDVTVSPVEFEADGETRPVPKVTVNTPGVTVKALWSDSQGGTYSETPPDTSAPGLHLVWYRITASGYRPTTGSQYVSTYAPGATFGWRLSSDGGATWVRVGSTEVTAPTFHFDDVERNIVEILEPECTYCEDLELKTSCTFRSPAGMTNVLRRTAASLISVYGTFAISNLVCDGGAVWADPDDIASAATAVGSVGARNFVCMKVGAQTELGAGVTVRNYLISGTGSDGWGMIGSGSGVSCVTKVLPGVVITDCRGGAAGIIYIVGRCEMSGGVITRCYPTQTNNGYCGVVTTRSGGRLLLSGGAIVSNAVPKYAAVYSPDSGSLEFSGNSVVRDNFCAGVQKNAAIASGSVIKQTGDLAPAAFIGVSHPAVIEKGAEFGQATGTWAGASAFHADARPAFHGRIKAGKLVWSAPGMMLLFK